MTRDQREAAVAWFEKGIGDSAVATLLKVSRWPVRSLYHRWRIHGGSVLVEKRSRPRYSFELKFDLVTRFQAGEPLRDLAVEGKLSSPQLLQAWARAYRAGGEDALRPKPRGRPSKASLALGEVSESEELRRENDRLRAEVAYLGKLAALTQQQRRTR